MNIKDMTLEQKIGQMIVAGFPSKEYDGHVEELIKNKIGNIILFLRNVSDKQSLAQLNNKIQMAMLESTGVPAFITIDQEGGMVTRIYEGATFLPGNMAFAAAQNKYSLLKAGEVSGTELRALGINFNLAPVLDVNNNPGNPVIGVRSYSDDPEVVAECGVNVIKGLQSKGVVATAKHFPGHGDTNVDSHLALPVVHHDVERLERVELYPFKRAIENGVDAIMSAHVLFPAIESERLPGTLSHKVLTGLLREKMGFNGLIMTDCMEMKAIADFYGTTKAAVMAIKAGADLICVSHHLDLQLGTFEEIKAAVLSGELSESRIDESVARILFMKEKYNLFNKPFADMEQVNAVVGSKEHLQFAEAVSENSITVVKDEKHLLPIKSKNIMTIATEAVILTGADDSIRKRATFAEAAQEALGGEAYNIGLNPSDEEIADLAKKSSDKDLVVIGTYNASLNKGQAKLVNELLKVNKNIVVAALRIPYDINSFEEAPGCYICAYEYTPISVKSVIKVLTGEINANGKLPVRL
jgi:beta-N-acetylhexosaminidase